MCANRRNWMGERLTDGLILAKREKNPLFGARDEEDLRRTTGWIFYYFTNPQFM